MWCVLVKHITCFLLLIFTRCVLLFLHSATRYPNISLHACVYIRFMVHTIYCDNTKFIYIWFFSLVNVHFYFLLGRVQLVTTVLYNLIFSSSEFHYLNFKQKRQFQFVNKCHLLADGKKTNVTKHVLNKWNDRNMRWHVRCEESQLQSVSVVCANFLHKKKWVEKKIMKIFVSLWIVVVEKIGPLWLLWVNAFGNKSESDRNLLSFKLLFILLLFFHHFAIYRLCWFAHK